jgi:predicted aspartyl protease
MRKLLTVLAAFALAGPLQGQEQTPATAPAPQPTPAAGDEQTSQTLGFLPDITTRMTVAVNIDGRGPFRFVVDTGAERTVIARELARQLSLDPGRTVTVHSMTEVSRIPTVIIPGLSFGTRTVNGINAPALAQGNLGAAGMLGVDSLQMSRVEFDFERKEMTISPSRRPEAEWRPDNTIVVTGRSRFGRLMLVDAAVDGQRVWVILDTGSQVSVANNALRHALERHHRLGTTWPIELLSITGGRLEADYGIAHRVHIGGIDIHDLPIAFADVHPFRQLQLLDRPALLLGMDALQLFERVSVDFANRRVRVLIRDTSFDQPVTRVANGAPVRIAS